MLMNKKKNKKTKNENMDTIEKILEFENNIEKNFKNLYLYMDYVDYSKANEKKLDIVLDRCYKNLQGLKEILGNIEDDIINMKD